MQGRGCPAHRCGIRQKPRAMGCPASAPRDTQSISLCSAGTQQKGAVVCTRGRGKGCQHEEAQRTQAGRQNCSHGLDRMRRAPVSAAAARQARPCACADLVLLHDGQVELWLRLNDRSASQLLHSSVTTVQLIRRRRSSTRSAQAWSSLARRRTQSVRRPPGVRASMRRAGLVPAAAPRRCASSFASVPRAHALTGPWLSVCLQRLTHSRASIVPSNPAARIASVSSFVESVSRRVAFVHDLCVCCPAAVVLAAHPPATVSATSGCPPLSLRTWLTSPSSHTPRTGFTPCRSSRTAGGTRSRASSQCSTTTRRRSS